MLVFDHVSVFYGGTQVLRGLSFSIQDGEQVGLIGANGAGKSTLMKAALGLVPYTGSITVDGLPVTRENLPAVRRKLGYVLQDADNQMFMPTVLDDMLFGPMNYGLSREEAERQADETLASLHMEHLKLRHNHKMSGGEKANGCYRGHSCHEAGYASHGRAVHRARPAQPPHPDPRPARKAGDETDCLARSGSGSGNVPPRASDRGRRIGRRRPRAGTSARQGALEANGLELPLCLAGVPNCESCIAGLHTV